MKDDNIAAFNNWYQSAGLVESDIPPELLKRAFDAGFTLGSMFPAEKGKDAPNGKLERLKPIPVPAPKRPFYRRKRDGGPMEVKNPDAPATDAQYRYIKSLYAGDEAKARGIMTSKEYGVILSDIGTFTKGQASDLIDRLVKAGIRPSRR